MARGERPLLRGLLGQTDPIHLVKTVISNRYSLVAAQFLYLAKKIYYD